MKNRRWIMGFLLLTLLFLCGCGIQDLLDETPPDPDSLAYQGESFRSKSLRIFGYVVPGGRYGGEWRDVYRSYETGDTSYLTTVEVQVWDYTDAGFTDKYTRTMYLEVHRNIAATVVAIFAEIYDSPEQPVINYAGGYYASTKSEHDPGLAIDLNVDSNYFCEPDGTPITGSHWDPENDPYSIPIDGVIEQTFRKYGFTRVSTGGMAPRIICISAFSDTERETPGLYRTDLAFCYAPE